MLRQLLLLFFQLLTMFENHFGRLVRRRRRRRSEKAFTAHSLNCWVLQSTYFLFESLQGKNGMPPDPSMTDNINCQTVLCMLMNITLMVLSPVSANYKPAGDLMALVGRADLPWVDPPAWSSSCRQQSWRVTLISRCCSLTASTDQDTQTPEELHNTWKCTQKVL